MVIGFWFEEETGDVADNEDKTKGTDLLELATVLFWDDTKETKFLKSCDKVFVSLCRRKSSGSESESLKLSRFCSFFLTSHKESQNNYLFFFEIL